MATADNSRGVYCKIHSCFFLCRSRDQLRNIFSLGCLDLSVKVPKVALIFFLLLSFIYFLHVMGNNFQDRKNFPYFHNNSS